MAPCLLDKLHEGRHKVFQAGPKSFVQVEGDPEAQQAILLVVSVEHIERSLHQRIRVWPQQVIVWQPACA